MAERRNRTFQEVARTMLSEAKLSDGYWRESISTIVYILNRGQLRVNSKKTPYELWYGRSPSVKYFRVFGSKCYIKNLDKDLENSMLDPMKVFSLVMPLTKRDIDVTISDCTKLLRVQMSK